MEYKFSEIEEKIKSYWKEKDIYRVGDAETGKPKYYVLDMFPYPSGAGLHVGHPLGYIASDIYARYKRMKGFNVLHPMGYDSFGLPAEQYAIQTGQHPAETTKINIDGGKDKDGKLIEGYRAQLDKMGFSFDWNREVRTSDQKFYKWTQWIFILLFESWYNQSTDKAENISSLLQLFEAEGNTKVKAAHSEVKTFSADEWKQMSEKMQQEILMQYRMAFLSEAYVNWCPALGTVLANDEVKDGVSERGGYPVERKLMKQWSLRITAYSERLLKGLDDLNWSESIKESQRNWIGKSEGARIIFDVESLNLDVNKSKIQDPTSKISIEVFTTRPDTLFGVTFLTLAPEHELIEKITPASHKKEVDQYVTYAKNRSERERMTEVKKITGQFTGAYAIHPFTGKQIPIYVGEYVLAGYGTGAVMAVPGHDSRDYGFAKHFNLEIIEVIAPSQPSPKGKEQVLSFGEDLGEVYEGEGTNINSSFLDGLKTPEAKKKIIEEIEKKKIGERKINFKQRDAVFGRQRYWGEPIPVYYDEQNIPRVVDVTDLPVKLPEIEKYLPTETGEPPLARAKNWKYSPLTPLLGRGAGGEENMGEAKRSDKSFPLETTTMPGWAGSSWYFLRYMDPHNKNEFASREKLDYWKQIDYYGGGSEHATGHLLYFRFWTKFLKDLGYINIDEPAKRLVNQGMIQGVSGKIRLGFYFDEKLNRQKQFLIPTDYPVQSPHLPTINYPIQYLEYQTNLKIPKYLLTKENHTKASKEYHFLEGIEFYPSAKDLEKIFSEIPKSSDFFSGINNKIDDGLIEVRHKKFILEFSEKSEILLDAEVEKMSKSKYNVVNPDEIIEKYGADCFRMYEMFLGPLEMSKPWDTKGIDGVYRFLKKLWKLFYTEEGNWIVTDEAPTNAELKILHKTIKKVEEDIERLSYNTSVSAFMICVNELTDLKCHKKEVLKPLLQILAPFAPFTTEFLWQELLVKTPTTVGKVLSFGEDLGEANNQHSIIDSSFPKVREELLVENTFEYPIAINGKTRAKIELPLDALTESIEKEVLALESVQKYLEGKTPKKVIVVKGRMVNVVV